MGNIDADTVMVLAGVALSLIAARELYASWKRTRRRERAPQLGDDG